MNAFLRQVEAIRLAERERVMSEKGSTLPKDTRAAPGTSIDAHSLREQDAQRRREEKAAKLKAVARVMESGVSNAVACVELGVTERQLFWLKAKVRQMESSRGVVTR